MTIHGRNKAGPITLACGLIISGVVLLLYNLGAIPSLAWLWKLSPLLLIGIGLEYFLKQLLHGDPDPGTEVRFSGASLVLIIFLILAAWVFSVFSVAAGASGALGDLLASLPWSPFQQSYTRTWESQPLEIGEGDRLTVNNPAGGISLLPASGSQLTVRALIHAPASGPAREQADRENVEVKRAGSEVFVRTLNGGLDRVSFDLEVRLPAKINAVVYSRDGYVLASDLQGKLEVQAGEGRIELERVAGDISVQSGAGSVLIVDPGGDVTANTGNGQIEFSASHPLSGRYRLDCNQGRIEAALPRESDLALNAATGMGAISVSGLPGSDSLNEGASSAFSAKLGAGNGSAELRVETGSIEIRVADAGLNSQTGQDDLGVETVSGAGPVEIGAR